MYGETKIIEDGMNADPDAGPGADMPPKTEQEVPNDG